MVSKNLKNFQRIAVTEGWSYILLVFVAMPLKYIAKQPAPVKYLGWLHGVLFIGFCLLLLIVWVERKWSFKRAALAFFLSFVPFGTFWLDKQIRKNSGW